MSQSKSKTRDLARLPKAEIHLHLEGAMRPQTLRDLCAKHSVEMPTIPTIGPTTRFRDFSAFVDVYVAACAVLRTEEDVRRLVLETAEDLKRCNVAYAEIAPSLTFYSQYFASAEATLRLLADAASVAENETGVVLAYVVSAERHLGPDAAMEMARLARKGAEGMEINGRPAVVGFGLHGPEEGHPPGPFREAFEAACGDGGIASLPHAGEIAPSPGAGAGSVSDAVRLLKAKRIAHGVLAKDDAEAMRMLREGDVVCDMGITSNYLLNVVESLKDHPITCFLNEGVQCTINSDDPLLFGCNILSEYQLCRDVLGMDDSAIAECAKTSFRYSYAPEDLKMKGIKGVDEWLST